MPQVGSFLVVSSASDSGLQNTHEVIGISAVGRLGSVRQCLALRAQYILTALMDRPCSNPQVPYAALRSPSLP